MFQDGSVKAVLAKSSSVPLAGRISSPGGETHFAFLKPSTAEENQCRFDSGTNPRSSLQLFDYPASIASFSTVSSLLTLFSKFFSSFLHSTCLLSASHWYLALEEVYLPLWTSIPRSSTLWLPSMIRSFRHIRGYHPLCPSIRNSVMRSNLFWLGSRDYNSFYY